MSHIFETSLQIRVFDNKKKENTLLLQRIETSLCIVGGPSHEFIIIAFYDEGAGLVAVYWAV